MSKVYTAFAEVYDETYSHVPYFTWADYIHSTFLDFGVSANENVIEIACGTGALGRFLKPVYPQLLSLDKSAAMLAQASNKGIKDLLQADMLQLPLADNSFAGAFSCHDSLNYLGSYEQLATHFKEMARVLQPGGIYIFDLSSEENVIKNYDRQVFKNNFRKYKVYWQNFYDYTNQKITSVLEFTSKKETTVEVHEQLIFSEKLMLALTKKAGFTLKRKAADYKQRRKLSRANLVTYVLELTDNK